MAKNGGFTLVELMAVVTIIGLLIAMTLPTYKLNSTKARIDKVVGLLNNIAHDLLLNYSVNGVMPAALYGISGVGATGGYGPYMVQNETTFLHYVNGSTWPSKGALIQVAVDPIIGSSIPNYVATTNGADGQFNSIALGLFDRNGSIITYCGRWDSSSNIYITPEYLPSGCNSDNFASTVMG